MNSYETLLTEQHDQIIIVRINRPDALNALNAKVFDELHAFFTDEVLPPEVRVIILTGVGEKAFAAGADIKELNGLNSEQAEQLSTKGQMIFRKIETFHLPVIAAVNGFALGGGCELAMACHIRVASSNARFGQPEVSLGIIPGYGGTQRLIQLTGKGRAFELLLTGDMISAEEAYRIGLVNVVTDGSELLEKCKGIASKMLTKGPLALSGVIKSVNAFYTEGHEGYQTEARTFGDIAATHDFAEGTSAFIEKRKAVFTGK